MAGVDCFGRFQICIGGIKIFYQRQADGVGFGGGVGVLGTHGVAIHSAGMVVRRGESGPNGGGGGTAVGLCHRYFFHSQRLPQTRRL